MKIFILWSGGLDSTYLVYNMLSRGYEVIAAYTELKNNKEKTIKERAATEKLSKIFQQNFKDFTFKETLATYEIVDGDTSNLYFHQIPIWINSLLYAGPVSQVQIGYVMGDDAISYMSEIKKIYNSYKEIARPFPKLIFPLSKWSKVDIIKNLPEVYLKEVSFCESTTSDVCGDCKPCRKMKEALRTAGRTAVRSELFVFPDIADVEVTCSELPKDESKNLNVGS